MRTRYLLVLALVAVGCAGDVSPTTTSAAPAPAPPTTSPVASAPPTTSPVTTSPVSTTPVGEQACPQVISVEFQQTASGVFTVSTTVVSEDIEGVSFADAWEVRSNDGTVYGTRILAHPHANEQPFTRSLSGVEIPIDVTEVEVAARDSVRGFCGESLTVTVPHS